MKILTNIGQDFGQIKLSFICSQFFKRVSHCFFKIQLQSIRLNIINMILEDYYGFTSHRQNTTAFGKQKSYQRTERSPRIGRNQIQSPGQRKLKRTELSKQKMGSKDSKKGQHFRSPHQRQQKIQQQMSSRVPRQASSYEDPSYNSGQIEALARKYDNYLKKDFIEFVHGQISHSNESAYGSVAKARPQSRQPMQKYNRNDFRPSNRVENKSYEDRNYHSASRGRSDDFLAHFQRDKIPENAIDRANHTISQRSNNSRYKKSKSLTAQMKKEYKLHTFYHADRLKAMKYNDQGYLTQKQEQMMLLIEDRARRAFQRAANQRQSQHRTAEKRPSRPKKFEIEQSSRLQHRNSDILSDLKEQSANYMQRMTPQTVKRLSVKSSQKNFTEEKVIDVSINPKKSINLYNNEYQLKIGTKSDYQEASNSSISHFIDQKKGSIQIKNGLSNFAKQTKQQREDESLLQFKPFPPKNTANQVDNNPRLKKEKSENRSQNQQIKRNSDISEYKSVDMMQINSNCKINDKDSIKQKEKEKFEVNYADDNGSLGIDTLRNFAVKKKSSLAHKSSDLSINSQSLSRSQTISQVQSESNSNDQLSSKNSVSKSQNGTNKNFNKNKMRSSHSPSDDNSSSLNTQLIKPVEHAVTKKTEEQSKQKKESNQNSLSESSKLVRNDIEPRSKKIKVKRINRPNQNFSSQSYSRLGSQSLAKIDMIEPIQIKISSVPDIEQKFMSQIEQKNEKAPSLQSSRLKQQSRLVQKQSAINTKRLNSMNNSISNKSHHSVVERSRLRFEKHGGNQSNLQYDIFTEIREFIEEEQQQYHQPRKEKEIPEEISQQLDEVLHCIQEHLYLLNCISEIVIIVPDIYQFQTIYSPSKEWIFLPIFLTLKKYLYERNRVATALSGGKNCFNLLEWTIQDVTLKKYIERREVNSILINQIECNSKLELILANFQAFLKRFKKLNANQSYINTKPFSNSQELSILLTQYDKEIDNLLKKRVEQFNNGHIKENHSQFDMLILVNERIFRMMQVGFILSNLSGKQVKSYEKDEQLFREEQKFKDYISENHPLFKRMVKNFQ